MFRSENKNSIVEQATLAGGCFWCMEETFARVSGVLDVMPGYTGGHGPCPTYESVSKGDTGHAEAIQLSFNALQIPYEGLLDIFWRNIDPTTAGRQFCDVGSQYRPAIFYHDQGQRLQALASREALVRDKPFAGDVVVEIAPLDVFYPAEEHHQGFYHKNPVHFQRYRRGCGRDRRLRELWYGGEK